jgi:hypothetical protein
MDEQLELEMRKLVAERDIRRALFTYHEVMNRADYDALIPLLGDATIATCRAPGHAAGSAPVESLGPTQLRGVVRGGENFAHAVRSAWITYDGGNPRIQFCASNPIVEVADTLDTATCHAYFLMFQGLDANEFPLQLVSCGRYFDRYRNVDGRWQLVEREIYEDLAGDPSKHIRAGWGGEP